MVDRIRDAWRPEAQLPWLGLFLYFVWVLLAPRSMAQELVGMLGVVAARSAAAFALRAAGRSLAEERIWQYLGVGAALWAIGSAIAAVIRLQTGMPPALPSASDWIYLAGFLAALTGLALYKRSDPERFGRVREGLDAVILALAVGSLAWQVFIRPALSVGIGDPISLLWAALPPTLGLILAVLFLRLAMINAGNPRASSFGWLAVAAALLSMFDLVSAWIRLQGEAASGALLAVGWTAAALIVLQVGQGLNQFSPRPADPHVDPGRFERLSARLEPLLPLALTYLVVGSAILGWWLTGEVDWFAIATAALLSLLLVARQGVIIGQTELRQFAALVNASADLAFICDSNGNLILANPAFCQAVGVAEEEIVEANLSDFLVAEGPQSRFLGAAMKHGYSDEFRLRSPHHQNPVPVFLSLRPLPAERRAEPLLAGTAMDLTLIKQREIELQSALGAVAAAQAELEGLNAVLEDKVQARTTELEHTIADLARLNEELKALDHMKSEFVALVSHELRAPLTNIRSGVELVLEREQSLGANLQESLLLIQQETERLGQLVEATLDISALEAGRFPLRLEPIDLAEITTEVRAQVPQLARLSSEIPEDLPFVLADEGGLKSVLYHLFDNASKYAPEGDLRLEAEADGSNVRVALSDSGPGIPIDEKERIFDMFHRLDNRDSREVYGHGLGLPMARRLLEAMGGGIRAEPSSDKGARFVFWLPKAEVD